MGYFSELTSQKGGSQGPSGNKAESNWLNLVYTAASSSDRDIQLKTSPVPDSTIVQHQGLLLTKGEDYTVSADVVTIDGNVPLSGGDVLQVRYQERLSDFEWAHESITVSQYTAKPYVFDLNHPIYAGSEIVSLSGVALTRGEDYTLGNDYIELDSSYDINSARNWTVRYQYRA
ncbi:MAG: hypothetical protein ABEN55_02685 [Bradymonadaceae bacterium]